MRVQIGRQRKEILRLQRAGRGNAEILLAFISRQAQI
jgi:hypothetical protein